MRRRVKVWPGLAMVGEGEPLLPAPTKTRGAGRGRSPAAGMAALWRWLESGPWARAAPAALFGAAQMAWSALLGRARWQLVKRNLFGIGRFAALKRLRASPVDEVWLSTCGASWPQQLWQRDPCSGGGTAVGRGFKHPACWRIPATYPCSPRMVPGSEKPSAPP